MEQWKQRDPIATFAPELQNIEAEVSAELAEAVAFAEAGSWEPVEDLLKDVHTPP